MKASKASAKMTQDVIVLLVVVKVNQIVLVLGEGLFAAARSLSLVNWLLLSVLV